jgi:hypothetical protein
MVRAQARRQVMDAMYASYEIAQSGTGQKRGLSIRLSDPRHKRPGERVKDLHAAAAQWAGDRAEAGLESNVGGPGPAHCVARELSDYLWADGSVNMARLVRHLEQLHQRGTLHLFVPKPGGLIEGPDLIGRQDLVSQIVTRLESGPVHLRASRRYGKSSLLHAAAEAIERSGRTSILLDFSMGSSSAWFFAEIAAGAMQKRRLRPKLAALPELAGWPSSGAPPGTRAEARDKLAERISRNPGSFGNPLLRKLKGEDAVVFLDEFSVFLRSALQEGGEEDMEILLGLLYDLQAKAESMPPMVIAGSSGLESYKVFKGLRDWLEGLSPVDVPPLSDSEASLLIEELLYGSELNPDAKVIAQFLREIGVAVPYFIHALADMVRAACAAGGSLTAATVTKAYQERLLGYQGSHFFKAYGLAGQVYPEALKPFAGWALRRMASKEGGMSRRELARHFASRVKDEGEDRLDALMGCMEEDYDLERTKEGWRMRNKVIRDRIRLSSPWLGGGD